MILGPIDADESVSVTLSVTRALPHDGPVVIDRLERHPFTSQTFLPLTVLRWLVVVAAEPAGASLRAFWVGPGMGVTIGRGVWHHGLTVFDGPAEFAVVMGRSAPGGPPDDEWRPIDRTVIAE